MISERLITIRNVFFLLYFPFTNISFICYDTKIEMKLVMGEARRINVSNENNEKEKFLIPNSENSN